jgi:hypothetical protein
LSLLPSSFLKSELNDIKIAWQRIIPVFCMTKVSDHHFNFFDTDLQNG